MQNLASAMKGLFTGFTLGQFVINVLLTCALSLLWGMINGMQLISLLPLVNCVMPGNVWFVFNQMFIFASFNVVNTEIITNYISDRLNLQTSANGLSPRLINMGFESTNIISNLGIVFIFMIAIIIATLILALLRLLSSFSCGSF